jgi:hypothetical protein
LNVEPVCKSCNVMRGPAVGFLEQVQKQMQALRSSDIASAKLECSNAPVS